jgi:glutamyl-Q tRNA(Asp) synthetase
VLQELLDLPVPDWHHHGLLLGNDGSKLSKSRGSASLAERRANGEDGRLLAEQLRLQQMLSGT